MSQKETLRLRKYGEPIGVLLIEECLVVQGNKDKECGSRVINGIIVLGKNESQERWFI